MGSVREISAGKTNPSTSCHGRLRAIVWFAAVFIGASLTWKFRNVIDNDTISHLDMADCLSPAFVYLAAGCLLRMCRGAATRTTFVLDTSNLARRNAASPHHLGACTVALS